MSTACFAIILRYQNARGSPEVNPARLPRADSKGQAWEL